MALEGNGAFTEFATGHAFEFDHWIPAFGFDEIDGDFTVHFESDVLAFDFDLVVEPFAVNAGCGGYLDVLPASRLLLAFGESEDVDHAVEAAGLLRVLVRAVDLAFVPGGGPAGVFVLGVEVNAGVGAGRGFDLHLEFKTLKLGVTIRTGVEKMSATSADFEQAVFDREAAWHFVVGFPAREVFSIEDGGPAVGIGGMGDEGERPKGAECGECEWFEHKMGGINAGTRRSLARDRMQPSRAGAESPPVPDFSWPSGPSSRPEI